LQRGKERISFEGGKYNLIARDRKSKKKTKNAKKSKLIAKDRKIGDF